MQPLEAGAVAVRVLDQRERAVRAPPLDRVAGERQVRAVQEERHGAGRVAGRVDRREGDPAAEVDAVAVFEGAVGPHLAGEVLQQHGVVGGVGGRIVDELEADALVPPDVGLRVGEQLGVGRVERDLRVRRPLLAGPGAADVVPVAVGGQDPA